MEIASKVLMRLVILSSAPVMDTIPVIKYYEEMHFCNSFFHLDPHNCSRYHLCGESGATGLGVNTYECPKDFVYNPATTMCKWSPPPNGQCAVIDCSIDPIGNVVYPADNQYFASCSPNEEPLMLKCPQNFVFNPAVSNCVRFNLR